MHLKFGVFVWRRGDGDAVVVGALRAAARQVDEDDFIAVELIRVCGLEERREVDFCGFVEVDALQVEEEFSGGRGFFVRGYGENAASFIESVEETASDAVWRFAVAEDGRIGGTRSGAGEVIGKFGQDARMRGPCVGQDSERL